MKNSDIVCLPYWKMYSTEGEIFWAIPIGRKLENNRGHVLWFFLETVDFWQAGLLKIVIPISGKKGFV